MKTSLKILLIYNLAFNIYNCSAQNIGINGTGANAHPSALLDVDDAGTNTKGLLIPRIALTAINVATPVTSPATSLLVYNTASASTGTNAVSPGYYYWDATKWVRFAYSPSGSSASAWTILGNAGTNPTTNFLGTTDAQDLVFRTNNTEKMRVMSAGNVGVGTNNPAEKFTIEGGNLQLGEVLATPALGRQLFFSDAGNNSFDPIYFQRQNIANDVSSLNLNIGDNHSNIGGTGGDRFTVGAFGGFGFASILTVLSTSTVQAPGSSVLDIRPRVGINTYEPLSDLHVGGNIEASWTSPGATHSLTTYGKLVPGALYLRGAPVGTYSFTNGFIDFVNDVGGGYDFRIAFQRNVGPNGSLSFSDNVNGGFLNIEQGSGNVGVHTSPLGISTSFQVGASVTDGISIKGGALSGGDPGDFIFLQNDGIEKGRISTHSSLGVGGLIFSGSTTAGGVNHMNIQQNGNVGIGTTSPALKLHLHDAGQNFHALRFTAGSSQANYWDLVKRGEAYGAGENHNFVIAHNSVERVSITPTGEVGLASSTPDSRFDVYGAKPTAGGGTGASNNAASQAIIADGSGGASYQNDWPVGWGGGLATWDICGQGTFFALYNTRSDRRLKKDITDMNQTIESNFMKLHPVTYLFKKETPEINGTQYGFIAQEVAELFPTLVTKDAGVEGATIGMNYQGLIAPTVHVVQEQQKKIEQQQIQISELLKRIEALEKK